MKTIRRLAALLLVLCMLFAAAGCEEALEEIANAAGQSTTEDSDDSLVLVERTPQPENAQDSGEEEEYLDPDGSYTTKEDVALYLHIYGELPSNFMTKDEARALGWSGGGLEDYAPGMCIGGDRFGNYEGLLPDGSYHECDIDTLGASRRGAKRIIYSTDGRIYYTDDHYESFTLLYGEE